MTKQARTEAIDEWLKANHENCTVRQACLACKCSPETVSRREIALGIRCVRHTLKRESVSQIKDGELIGRIRHMRWAPDLDYLEEPV